MRKKMVHHTDPPPVPPLAPTEKINYTYWVTGYPESAPILHRIDAKVTGPDRFETSIEYQDFTGVSPEEEPAFEKVGRRRGGGKPCEVRTAAEGACPWLLLLLWLLSGVRAAGRGSGSQVWDCDKQGPTTRQEKLLAFVRSQMGTHLAGR
jgi:hypothetical protein